MGTAKSREGRRWFEQKSELAALHANRGRDDMAGTAREQFRLEAQAEMSVMPGPA
jgi:hypothetical protein